MEEQYCKPKPIFKSQFNANCTLPYQLETDHIFRAMCDFNVFLGFINTQMVRMDLPRFESFLMPANFSSIVGEFMNMTIPKYCSTLTKNLYHNGHPDLIPSGMFENDSVQYAHDGIEIKGSRHSSGWQGHNPEAVWLMVFHFDSNTANDHVKKVNNKQFEFKAVYAAKLEESDWNFSGRSSTSRRTITASVNRDGVAKMKNNWIYKA